MESSLSKRERRISKSLTIAGLFFISLGLIGNEWILARLVIGDGLFSLAGRLIVWIVDLVLIGSGASLVYFRKNVRTQTNLALLFGALFVCLFIAEVFLSLTGLAEVEQEEVRLFMENPNGTGSYRLKPDLDITTEFYSEEITMKTNSLGMRWRAVSYDNPLGKERIAFVGDSITYGVWADKIENSFVGVFDSLSDSERFEVLNFGVPGYGLRDMELQIKEQVLPFKPDYIILMFGNASDFGETYLGKDWHDVTTGVARWDTAVLESKIPAEFREVSGQVSMPQKVRSLVLNRSLYRLFVRGIGLASEVQTVENGVQFLDFSVSNLFMSRTFWSQRPYPEVALKAKDISLEVLDRIRELSTRNDIQLIIVALPFREQVYASSLSGENYDVNFPQRYVDEYSVTHSVPYLDLLPILRSYVRENDEAIYPPSDAIHFNNDGHRIVGELVARFFEEKVLNE